MLVSTTWHGYLDQFQPCRQRFSAHCAIFLHLLPLFVLSRRLQEQAAEPVIHFMKPPLNIPYEEFYIIACFQVNYALCNPSQFQDTSCWANQFKTMIYLPLPLASCPFDHKQHLHFFNGSCELQGPPLRWVHEQHLWMRGSPWEYTASNIALKRTNSSLKISIVNTWANPLKMLCYLRMHW